MSVGLVDTTVIIHYFRNNPAAITWVNSQPVKLSITSISWMEVMEGSTSKTNQQQCKTILSQFELLAVSSADQKWAMQQLEQFQFSHHIGMNDCLIASVSYRLQIPLYTHNIKHMSPLIGQLAVKPY